MAARCAALRLLRCRGAGSALALACVLHGAPCMHVHLQERAGALGAVAAGHVPEPHHAGAGGVPARRPRRPARLQQRAAAAPAWLPGALLAAFKASAAEDRLRHTSTGPTASSLAAPTHPALVPGLPHPCAADGPRLQPARAQDAAPRHPGTARRPGRLPERHGRRRLRPGARHRRSRRRAGGPPRRRQLAAHLLRLFYPPGRELPPGCVLGLQAAAGQPGCLQLSSRCAARLPAGQPDGLHQLARVGLRAADRLSGLEPGPQPRHRVHSR